MTDIEAAKLYLKKRIFAEKRATLAVEKHLLEAAKEIIMLCYTMGINPQKLRFANYDNLNKRVDQIIENMCESLIGEIEKLAVYEKDDTDIVMEYFWSLGNGKSFRERMFEYAGKFKYEMEAIIAAGMSLGLSYDKMVSDVKKNFRDPYESKLMKTGSTMNLSALRFVKNVELKKGDYKTAFASIDRLSTSTVAMTWFWYDTLVMKNSGAIGYVQYRGSSYPCTICDSQVGFHPFSDFDEGYPHYRCHCFRVPVYTMDM